MNIKFLVLLNWFFNFLPLGKGWRSCSANFLQSFGFKIAILCKLKKTYFNSFQFFTLLLLLCGLKTKAQIFVLNDASITVKSATLCFEPEAYGETQIKYVFVDHFTITSEGIESNTPIVSNSEITNYNLIATINVIQKEKSVAKINGTAVKEETVVKASDTTSIGWDNSLYAQLNSARILNVGSSTSSHYKHFDVQNNSFPDLFLSFQIEIIKLDISYKALVHFSVSHSNYFSRPPPVVAV